MSEIKGSAIPSSPPFRTALLAGALAGITVDMTLFPLDTLKTRLQASSGFFAAGGFSGIYRGVGSALVGSAPGAAFFFCTYEAVKQSLSSSSSTSSTSHMPFLRSTSLPDPVIHIIAASLGEIAACAVRVPTEVVKQRAQAGLHNGSSAAALRAILARYSTKDGGLYSVYRELYRGWAITVFRELPFTAIQFPLWEAMKAWARDARRRRSSVNNASELDHVSAAEGAFFGSVAGAIAAGATTPLDVLKTRVMLSKESVSVRRVFSRMLREEGVRPFFAGIVPRVTWISIGGAIFLGSYQWAINTLA